MSAMRKIEMAPIKVATTMLGARVTQGGVVPGGLDLLTPSLTLQSGALRDVLNFECSLNGGYGRIAGYERFNGMPAPSAASFAFVQVASFVNVPEVGSRISQVGTGATGTVALVNNVSGSRYMVVTQTAGSFNTTGVIVSAPTTFSVTEDNSPFVVTEADSPFIVPTDAAVTIGTAITPTVELTPLLNAQFQAAAADIYRASIDPVPGSGPILGVIHMIFGGTDQVYAFRANELETEVNVYRASAAGWVPVPLLNSVSFTGGGTAEPQDGDTLIQGAATATINRVAIASGTIAGNTAAGIFVIDTPTLGLAAGPATTSSGATVTLTGPQTPIVLQPGGRFEFVKCNFAGQIATRRIYGCDGVNPAFEFDGTTLTPIATGAVPDTPSHIAFHKNYLFLSQESSIFHSAPGFPFKYSSVDGGGEIATGDTVNAMLTLPGAQTTAALGIWMKDSTAILYGTDPTTFNFVLFNVGIGAMPNSVQNLFDTFAFSEPGIVNLQATLNFGNFQSAAFTRNIQPLINQERSKITSSMISHTRGQYRVFFNDGYGLWLTMLNQQYLGASLVQFPNPVNCCDNDTNTSGAEVSYFGSTDDLGYVYQLDTGPSFDGEDLFAYMRLAWDYLKSSEFQKQFRRVRVEIQSSAYASIDFGYALGDGSPLIGQPSSSSYAPTFSSSMWDNFTWDNFYWDGQTLSPSYVSLDGTAQDIQPVIGCSTNYIQPFIINSLTYQYTVRRRLRGL